METINEQEKQDLIAKNKAADELTPMQLDEAIAKSEPEAELTPVTDPLDAREVQIAAGQYAQFCKQIRSRAKNMKAGGLARVLIAAAEFPFAESYPKFRAQAETDLFILLTSNDKAKGVVHEALKSSQIELQQEAADNVTNNILTKGSL